MIRRAIHQLCTEANKERKCPALHLDTSCRSFMFGRRIVTPVFKCAPVPLVPIIRFTAFIHFNRSPPISLPSTKHTIHTYTCFPAPYVHTSYRMSLLPLYFIFLYTFFFLWCCGPTRVLASSFTRFLDHTQRRTTVSRTPLVIRSSQRPLRDNTQHSQETFMPPEGFEPRISAGEQPQTHALDRAATGIGLRCFTGKKYILMLLTLRQPNLYKCRLLR